MANSIYVVVCQTGTGVAKMIKFFTKKPYNHSSVSTDRNLSEMYSFCRTYMHSPLPATFNREIIGEGTLGLYDNIPCELYEIPVSYEQKREFERILNHFKTNRLSYSYNIMGLISIPLNKKLIRKNKFVCSQFVAHILTLSGIRLNKPIWLYSPEDLRYLPNAKLIYRGELNTYFAQINATCSA